MVTAFFSASYLHKLVEPFEHESCFMPFSAAVFIPCLALESWVGRNRLVIALKVCGDIWGTAPREPKLFVVMAQ